MPRNVRNFFLHAEVDGVQRPLRSGPEAKDGGFTLNIYQRHEGEVVLAAEVYGQVLDDGTLRLTLYEPGTGESRTLFETVR